MYKNPADYSELFGPYQEGLKTLLKTNDKEAKEFKIEAQKLPLGERLSKLKELYEGVVEKQKLPKEIVLPNEPNKEIPVTKIEEQKGKQKKEKGGKKEAKVKDLEEMKKTWHRLEKNPMSDVIKELGEEEYTKQLKEVFYGNEPKVNCFIIQD
jgi:hypothetical protein